MIGQAGVTDQTAKVNHLDRSADTGEDEPELRIPTTLELSQNYPNPFNPSTTVRITAPEGQATTVTLSIYDIRGRLVRILYSGVLESGGHSFSWDGRDNTNTPVASGVYFCICTTDRERLSRKMIIAE